MIGLARIGGPVACLGLALLLSARTRRDRLAGLGFAAIGACMLAAALAPGRAAEAAAAFGVLVVCGSGLAAAYRRAPWLLPGLALACIPIRIGVLGHQLLAPLYVVIAGAAVLTAWELARGDARSRELGIAAKPLAWYVAWVGLSLGWTVDVREGAIEVLAFYVPLAILAAAVARLPWDRFGLRALAVEVTAMGLAFAALGIYQYETRDIFQNPKVINANAYAPFFRVNSVFWDPSVYGRFLVIAMLPSLVVVALGRRLRLAWVSVVALVVLWVGLLISFSQSSFAALLVAVIGTAFVAWRWRSLVAVLLAVAVIAGIAVSQPRIRRSLQTHTVHSLNQASSGRASLVANGIRIAVVHPALGVGVGGFKHAYAKRVHLKGKNPKKAASHDTPVTIAAETGLIGLALYAWLLVGLARQALRSGTRVALIAALGLAAIVCHSLFYADFFEDPTTWGLMGLVALAPPAAAVAARRRRQERKEAVPV